MTFLAAEKSQVKGQTQTPAAPPQNWTKREDPEPAEVRVEFSEEPAGGEPKSAEPRPAAEIVHVIAPPQIYENLFAAELTAEQVKILTAEPTAEELAIKPTGEVYMSHAVIRDRLNDAFGPLKWMLIEQGKPFFDDKRRNMFQEYALFVNVGGKTVFVAKTIGENPYFETNEQQTYGDAYQGVRSNALMRCCKDFMTDCWRKGFTERFQAEHCVRVWAKPKWDGQVKPMWRRKDGAKLPYEQGPYNEKDAPPQQEAPPLRKSEAAQGGRAQENVVDKGGAQAQTQKPAAAAAAPQGESGKHAVEIAQVAKIKTKKGSDCVKATSPTGVEYWAFDTDAMDTLRQAHARTCPVEIQWYRSKSGMLNVKSAELV